MDTADPPSGSLAFLFTDVVGSTAMWEAAPQAMAGALARHDEIVKRAAELHGGYLFSTAGDSFGFAFTDVEAAVGCAVAGQRELRNTTWPEQAPIAVRMGIHIGTAQHRDGNFFGSPVNRAARVASLAQASQILATERTLEQLDRTAVPDLVADPVGSVPLRGLTGRERLVQLSASGLPTNFVPLAEASPATNIAKPTDSFHGRTDEVGRLLELLDGERLVTLVGTGGVGKTRLAIETARRIARDGTVGVWFIDLVPAADEDSIAATVAEELGVSATSGANLLDEIAQSLAGQPLVLVFDNCEHVIGPANRVIGHMLTTMPELRVLATSREPLAVAGEQIFTLAPLGEVATALFVARASAARIDFQPTPRQKELIERICDRLDGIPLAIELAASRVRVLGIDQIAERLDDVFRVARRTSGPADRHQTLRDAIAWSYELLDPTQQLFFDRLWVFAGSFDLEAAEAVCGSAPLHPDDVLDLLSDLIDKSLVQIDRTTDTTRYVLLDSLRQFSRAKDAEAGSPAALREAHVRHYLSLAELAAEDYRGSANAEAATTFDVEWNNLRAARAHLDQTGDDDRLAQLTDATFWFGFWTSRAEHAAWATELAEGATSTPRALAVAALHSWIRGEYARSIGFADRALLDAESDADTAMAELALGLSSHFAGRSGALDHLARAVHHATACDDRYVASQASSVAASLAATQAPETARDHLERARSLHPPAGNASLDAFFAYAAGRTLTAEGRLDDALTEYRNAATIARASDNRTVLGLATLMVASHPGAADAERDTVFLDALGETVANRSGSFVAMTLRALVVHFLATDRAAAALTIFGFLEAAGLRATQAHRIMEAAALPAAAAMGSDGDEYRRKGSTMTTDAVVTLARDWLNSS